MLKNLSLTLIAVAVLSACSSSGSSPSSRLDTGANVIGAGSTNNNNNGNNNNNNGNNNNGNNNNNGSDSNGSLFPKKNNPQPQPVPQPNPQPQPAPQPTPQPQPQPTPQPQPQPNPQPNPQPQPNDPVPAELKAAVEKAKTITTEQATALDAHLFYNPLHELTIDGKTYRYHNRVTSKDNDLINFSNLPMGYSTREVTYSVTPAPAAMGTTDLDPSKKDTAKGVLTVYQRPYSVVFAELLPLYGMDTSAHPFSFSDECKGSITNTGCYRSSLVSVLGYQTPYETLKGFAEGNQKFTYNGEAFTATEVPERGLFNYQVAFALDKDGFFDVKGSGSITGLNSFGTITLGEGTFRLKERVTPTDKEWDGSHTGVMNGNATASKGGRIGAYALGFFGPNAEEIAGQGSFGSDLFGFSGAR